MHLLGLINLSIILYMYFLLNCLSNWRQHIRAKHFKTIYVMPKNSVTFNSAMFLEEFNLKCLPNVSYMCILYKRSFPAGINSPPTKRHKSLSLVRACISNVIVYYCIFVVYKHYTMYMSNNRGGW